MVQSNQVKDDARPYEPAQGPTLRRITAGAIKRRKGTAPVPMVTAYDVPFARFAEEAGIDWILVGDSLGNVVLGYDETTPVTMDQMIHHTAAVSRGTARAHIVADMPFGSYQVSNEEAVRNAIRFVKEAGAQSVKLEGGVHEADRVRAIARTGIPVVGHIGVTPQTAGLGPGYRKRTHRDRLLEDALAIEAAGAYAIVLEVVDNDIARELTQRLSILTVGIGSGGGCDAQVLVLHDLLGMYPHSPPFAKRFAEIGLASVAALRDYASAVKDSSFP
ncbi:MAG: 3-methyl-2-oxobutanoate hydroxymethyltransferase [Candidatus Eremiobacteraeota bacterium]|nr:3-methyl-2-oxobutanoate hydroxymethyltransferase [Candidatus Eremiobacteraeota bacterium]